jgi:hypothetical protein
VLSKRLFWLVACSFVRDNHERDWDAEFEMGLSRCRHCLRPMEPPPLPARRRL